MTDSERLTPAYRLVQVLPVAFLGLTLLTRLGNAIYWSGPGGGAVLAALFVLPLLYAVPLGRAFWARHAGWLLAVQAMLTYAPLAVFGQRWINAAAGLLAGLLLLTVRAPRSWPLFGAVVVVEAARIAVLGIPWNGPKSAFYTWMLVAPVVTGLALFGLVRPADLVATLRAARTELAELAVAAERRWSADRLRTAIGDNLEATTEHVRAAIAVLPTDRDAARAELTAAAKAARRGLEQVRTAVAADQPRPASLPSTSGVAPRLARVTLAVVLAGQAVILTANVLVAGGSAVAIASIAVLVALQLHHSLGWRAAARPRGWPFTLAVQTLLPFAWFPAYDWNILTLAGFAAGSAVLLLPRRWGWSAFVAVVTGVGVAWSLPVLGLYYGIGNRAVYGVATDSATVLYQAGAAATAGIVVYGLSRLPDLAEQVEAVRRQLASAALARERERVAQDTHDLLGLGLSALALKSDLAGKLVGRDDERASGELAAMLRLAGQARADLRSVTVGESAVSLQSELAAARTLLTSAGVSVDVRGTAALPEQVDAVLATVLREAVTNVLRHSDARWCEIEVAIDGVRVVNDGVRDEATERRGRGLANMSSRASALGGEVSASRDGDRFELTVRVPSAGEDTLAARDASYGVGEEVGRSVLDQEAGGSGGT
ncbi:sensor histidine kinase [Fodinicola acaciae]|uniref:sensor histidine kinase n=1 Tax=Fodinicola acaciae TaxID=2681555 RepID=UPI0013D18EFA|nr:histidine kinase [Fodinicola acaciae]